MKALVETELSLGEPSAVQGLVTWFRAQVVDDSEGGGGTVVGRGRVGRIHVGMAAGVGASLSDALAADSAELSELCGVFFEEDWFRQQFTEGTGSDLLYLSEVTFAPGWQARNVDLALVRRLCDTLGQGCELAVLRAGSEKVSRRWQRLGFRSGSEESGFLHLPLGSPRARVLASQDDRSFCVISPAER